MSANVDDLGPTLLGVAWSFAIVGTAVVATRAYTRFMVLKKIQIDDWLIFATLALAIMNSIFCTISVHYGLGKHMAAVSNPQEIPLAIKYVYLCEFFSIMTPGIGRISYAFLLLEIVPPNKTRRRFLWAIIWIQFVVDLATVIISFSQCQPIQSFWERPADAKCWDPRVQEYTGFTQGSVCSLVDLLLALFPASMLWNLNMKLGTKISLSIMMGSGIFAMICSIIKTIELQAIRDGDLTHAMATLAIWWTLEAYMVLIAASIPTLRALATQGRKSHDTSSSKGGDNKTFGLKYLRSNRALAHHDTFISTVEGPFVKLSAQESVPNISNNNNSQEQQSSIKPEHHGGIRKDFQFSLHYEPA